MPGILDNVGPMGLESAGVASRSSNSKGKSSKKHQPRRKGRSVSARPGPPDSTSFDVVYELTHNRRAYTGNESAVSLYNVPSYLLTCIERIQSRVATTSRPGIAAVLCCCVRGGLEVLSTSKEVKGLLALKNEVTKLDPGNDAALTDDLEVLNEILRSFKVRIPDGSVAGRPRLNVSMPASIKRDLGSFSADLGMSMHVLLVYAAFVTLVDQPGSAVLSRHRELMQRCVSGLLRAVDRRKALGAAMVRWLESNGD